MVQIHPGPPIVPAFRINPNGRTTPVTAWEDARNRGRATIVAGEEPKAFEFMAHSRKEGTPWQTR
jgi:hypothetical protein